MKTVNAIGDACPIPVVKTMNMMKSLTEADVIEVFVDNEIAVQNLTKMAKQKNCPVKAEKLEEKKFRVEISVGELGQEPEAAKQDEPEAGAVCIPDARSRDMVAVIASDEMGQGDRELGTLLMKGFIYALSQQDVLPKTILLYNGGARMSCEGSPALQDLKLMEAQGVEILTCGTCLNHYGLTEKLGVGSVTNMYVIAEKMTHADKIVKP